MLHLLQNPYIWRRNLKSYKMKWKLLSIKMKVCRIKKKAWNLDSIDLFGSDDDMNYYTGMSSHHFLALFAFVNAGDICSRPNNSSIQFPELENKGQKHSLAPKDKLFLTVWLALGWIFPKKFWLIFTRLVWQRFPEYLSPDWTWFTPE